MTHHISNLARRAAHAVKRQVTHRVAHLPHQLKHQLKHHVEHQLSQHLLHVAAIVALLFSMGGTWMLASDANAAPNHPTVASTAAGTSARSAMTGGAVADGMPFSRPTKKEVTGKLNLNTATEEQLMLLPMIGPSKAERIVTWRKKNGGFKRTADLRRVKGFGYKTFKRLEPYLDIKGDTTLAPRR